MFRSKVFKEMWRSSFEYFKRVKCGTGKWKVRISVASFSRSPRCLISLQEPSLASVLFYSPISIYNQGFLLFSCMCVFGRFHLVPTSSESANSVRYRNTHRPSSTTVSLRPYKKRDISLYILSSEAILPKTPSKKKEGRVVSPTEWLGCTYRAHLLIHKRV